MTTVGQKESKVLVEQKLITFYQNFYKKATDTGESVLPSGLDESHRRSLEERVYTTLRDFQNDTLEGQREKLAAGGKSLAGDFIEAAYVLEAEKSVLTFLLLNIDAAILDSQDNIKAFIEASKANPKRDLVKFLQRLLTVKESVYSSSIYDSAARILSAILADFDYADQFVLDSKSMINYLITGHFKSKRMMSDYVTVMCFTNLLMVNGMPHYFLSLNGFEVLQDILERNSKDLQISYYTLLCFWMLSFEEEFKSIACDPKTLLVANILSSLKKVAREKLTRVALKLFRNLSRWEECVALMIDNSLLQFLTIELKKDVKGEKTKENINYLIDILEKNYKIVSSWEKYIKEIKTERLSFGPCHTEKFWKENIKRIEESEFWVVKKLAELLDSKDEVTQAVACYDLGEFSRLHPYARNVLDKENGKNKLMNMVNKDNALVKENALVALQKLMITKWQMV